MKNIIKYLKQIIHRQNIQNNQSTSETVVFLVVSNQPSLNNIELIEAKANTLIYGKYNKNKRKKRNQKRWEKNALDICIRYKWILFSW